MFFRVFSVVVAAVMLMMFLAPPVLKLRELSLSVVIAIGLVMMAYDLWETLTEQKD
jgi:hypothetical protein